MNWRDYLPIADYLIRTVPEYGFLDRETVAKLAMPDDKEN